MSINNSTRPKIAHFGAFDHDSYGDLIFPHIVEHFLPEFKFVHISPSGRPTPWNDAKNTISIDEAFKINDWSGVLVGGGDIVQDTEGFIWNDSNLQSLGALCSLWSGASLLSAELGIPCAWNSPGVPSTLHDPFLSMAKDSIRCVDYLAVRDELSAKRIKRLLNHPLSIVPDTALVISEVFKNFNNNSNSKKALVLSLTPIDIEQRLNEIEFLIRQTIGDNRFSGKIVLLPLMRWQESDMHNKIETLKSKFDLIIKDRSLTLQECAIEISNCGCYVGNSLHGFVTALSYGVPAVHVNPMGYRNATKYEGFARHFSERNGLLADNFIEASKLMLSSRRVDIDKCVKSIKNHFNNIKQVLCMDRREKKNEWNRILGAANSEAKNLLLHGYSSYQLVNNRNRKLNELNGQIASLNQTLTTKDKEIHHLSSSLSQRTEETEQQAKEIHHLSSSLSQRTEETEQQSKAIDTLNQTLTEREGQIASLNQVVTEREGQIASLNQVVTEREGQIASLNQVVTEPEGQIARLTDETVHRGEWALGLEAKLKDVTNSNSWRITRPLREIRRWLSTPKEQTLRYCKAFVAILKRIQHHLPISYKIKRDIYRILCTRFPGISGLNAAKPSFISQNHLSKFIIDGPQNIQSLEKMLDTMLPIRVDEAPLVSVIIPVYGKINFTLSCLSSISENLPLAAFEVIVVDDCSPDNSVDILSKVKGIRVQRNENNQGFIRSCNIGAKAAKGQYLYFLNNDTVVTTGWLDELLCTFLEFPGTGLAGSKLVYPDGRLQEAGGIIWQDGSALNFGRYQDQQLPVYNYAREVDYCSGASIMVPKFLFEELGGFDEHYLPAYCEDSDLALKIRDKGYRVIYQPLSTVIHYEGITSGTDTTQGTKAYQVENLKKLFERWQKRLATHQAPGSKVDDAKDRRATKRVLVLDHCTPTPNQDAGSVTAFNLMLLLREMDFQVTFIAESNFVFMPEHTTALQRNGIEVLYAPYLASVVKHLKEQGARYDLILLIRPIVVSKYIEQLRKFSPKAKVLFDTVDLHYLRMQGEAGLYKDSKKMQNAIEMKEIELKAIKSVDATILRSESEYEMLRPILQKEKLHIFPLILDVSGTAKGFSKRKDIVFVGGYSHTPNIDAVKYFVKDIMPLLRKQLPGVRFYAAGSNLPTEIRNLASYDVIITGFVEHLNPFLDKMRVSIAPLRYGAGIKGKIGTAMAVGLPVVATSIAAEGMSLKSGENILLADEPEAFANAISKIYLNEGLWNSISQNGLAFADKTWGAQAAWEILAGILRELDLNPTRNNRELTLYTSNFQGRLRTKFERSTIEKDDDYKKKVKQELATFQSQVNVHDLPDIFHYWSNKYLTPIFRDAGFSLIAEFFSLNLLVAARRTNASTANFVSVGSGNCDLEVAIAKNLIKSGLDNFILECLELNPEMLERGKKIAKQNGVFNNIRFVETDFNTWVPSKRYDGVMANQSLHHVVQLEYLFDEVKNALHENGSFVISDMIGRNGHKRWPEALEIVNRFWKELPESKKFNVLLNRLEKEYDNWDCSKEGFEGIRAQDILPLLTQRFQCEKFVGFGNVIDIFVDRCFGHNFNRDLQEDRDLIDRLHAEDEAGFASGFLKPTHMIGVFVKTLHCAPYYSRGITPDSAIRNPNL